MIDGSYKCHILSYQMFQNWMKKKSAGNPVLMRNTSFVLNFLLTHPLIFSGSCVSFCGVPSRWACSASSGVFQCPAVPPLDATGQRFLNVFFPLHQRQGLKSLKSTWFTVRGCIPTLKCFRIISHLLSCCLGFVWRKPTRWAALSRIFLSTIRFATVHGLALMKPRNKSTGDRYIR